ncbi:hypothetical protein [Polyangium sp. 6x1]|uniref:hypothetical protein n=1 Tax=Polyangium sp. 6x1 TaxID=3042689 RepID=UPI002482D2F0|nr:hypothetical protein [Polyangium sp. 6x1]MDI1447483.1 hypothetical protein [Polyangium sp. 6x1]
MKQSHRAGSLSSGRFLRIPAILTAFAAALAARPAAADFTIGLVPEDSGSITSFDADTGDVFGTASLPFVEPRDCEIVASADTTRGLVAGGNFQLFVFDLTTMPPLPFVDRPSILLENASEDIALAPGGTFAVVCGGLGPEPISVVNVETVEQVNIFFAGQGCRSVDVCDDGSVLVVASDGSSLRRLTLGADGSLSDTGEVVVFPIGFDGHNVACAFGSDSAVVVGGGAPATIQSFSIPGLSPVETALLTASNGRSVILSPSGDRVFARAGGSSIEPGSVDAFFYEPTTGQFLGTVFSPLVVEPALSLQGPELLAIHPEPDDTKLYVPENGKGVSVFSAATGLPLPTIAAGSNFPTSICLATASITPAPAPPPLNDSILAATVIPSLPFNDGPYYTGSATTSTTFPVDPSDNLDCSGNGHTVWYSFVASEDARLTANTFGSDYDTTLSAFSGSIGALTPIACNNDTDFNVQSAIEFDVVAGQTYFLMVATPGIDPTAALGGMLQVSVSEMLVAKLIVDTKASLSSIDGSVVVRGTVDCSTPASVNLIGLLRQQTTRTTRAEQLFVVGFECDGPTSWSSAPILATLPYKGGKASLTISGSACGSDCVFFPQSSQEVHLTGGK